MVLNQSCYYQRLLNGSFEAIVQIKCYQHNDSIKMVIRRQFVKKALAEEWYRDNKDEIREKLKAMPFTSEKGEKRAKTT